MLMKVLTLKENIQNLKSQRTTLSIKVKLKKLTFFF